MQRVRITTEGILVALFAVVWVLLLGFSINNGIVSLERVSPPSDAGHYIDLGVSLAEHGTFSLDGISPFFEREPGYSVFLALVYLVAGSRNHLAVLIVQVLLHIGAALFFVHTARSFINRRASMILLGTLLFFPSIFHILFSFNRESFALSLVMISSACVLRLKERPRVWDAIVAGVTMGWLVLAYSPFLLFPFFLLAVLLLWRVKWQYIALTLLLTVLTVAPWGIRNMQHRDMLCLTGCYRAALQWHVRGEQAEHLHGFEPFRCLAAEYITRDWSGRSPYCSFNAVWHRKWPEGFEGVPEDALISKEGQAKILANFPNYLWFSAVDVIELHIPYVNGWGRVYNVFAALSTLLLYIGMIFAVPALCKKEYLLIGAFMGYCTGVFALTDATPRYLMPVIFCYALIAAVGYDRVLLRYATRKHHSSGV